MDGVKLTRLKIFSLKLALYTGGLLYIALDFFAFQGPLWHLLHERNNEQPADGTPVALNVYGTRFTDAQVQRRAAELATLRGETPAEAHRAAAVSDLIRNALLCMRARYNDTRIPDFKEEAAREVERLATRAFEPEHFEQWLKSQGYSRAEFTDRLTAIMRELYYLETTIAPNCEVTDAEVRSMMSQLEYYLVKPTRRHVRHIFFETLHKDAAEVKARAEAVLAQLQAASTPEELAQKFAELAKAHSEDLYSAPRGGDLGTVGVYPEPALKDIHLFGDKALPAHTPVMVESRWGWHIFLLGEIQEPEQLTAEECYESVRTAILYHKKLNAVEAWIQANIKEAQDKNRIQQYGN